MLVVGSLLQFLAFQPFFKFYSGNFFSYWLNFILCYYLLLLLQFLYQYFYVFLLLVTTSLRFQISMDFFHFQFHISQQFFFNDLLLLFFLSFNVLINTFSIFYLFSIFFYISFISCSLLQHLVNPFPKIFTGKVKLKVPLTQDTTHA